MITTYTLLMCSLAVHLSAYGTYLHRLPNSVNVSDPCGTGSNWLAIGHRRAAGHGPRNSFGIDFVKAGRKWTEELCNADSDKDGRSNGEELGDPKCVWKEGSIPANIYNITHPGVCEPLDNSFCKLRNSWLQCKEPKFDCADKEQANTTTFRISRFKIPQNDSTVVCSKFTLPSDDVYDVIASKVAIDNAAVTHQVLLYGCEDDSFVSNKNESWMCQLNMVPGCTSIIGHWSIGEDPICFAKDYGIRIGSNGQGSEFRYAVLQLKYNNLESTQNEVDSSGITIYYTKDLRPNRASFLGISQYGIFLPPGFSSYRQTAGCSSACSWRYLSDPVNITMAVVHMNSAGIGGSIEQYRDGKLLNELIRYDNYDYNLQQFSLLKNSTEFWPGDELKVNCLYNTTSKNNVTEFGEEACSATLLYYHPNDFVSFTKCGSHKEIGICGNPSHYVEPCNQTEAKKKKVPTATLR